MKLDETGADGFVPARTIGDDYYRYHEERHALIGDRTGETYRLGDKVTVKLVEAAPVAGALAIRACCPKGAMRRCRTGSRPKRTERPKAKFQRRRR